MCIRDSLRPGGVSRAEIAGALKASGINMDIARVNSQLSPGHLKTHYQPDCPIVIVDGQAWSPELKLKAERELKKDFEFVHTLALGNSPQLAARKLYENFREFSSLPCSLIVIERNPENSTQDWEAIWDRIERAASLTI